MSDTLDWSITGPDGRHLPVLAKASHLQLAVGHGAEWHEPGLPIFHQEIPHSYATREIISAPGSGELDGMTPQCPPWQVMRAAAGSLLSSAAFQPGCDAFEIRYVATPSSSGGSSRIRMFLTAMARAWTAVAAEAAVGAACAALPLGFTWVAPTEPLLLGTEATNGDPVIELRRHEEVTEPQWDYIPADFYYTVNDDPGDGSGWPMFWRALSESSEEVAVSLLFMQTDLHPDERRILGSIVTDLALYAEPRTEQNYLYQTQDYIPGCENARLALEAWHKRLAELQRPVLSRVAVRGPVETATPVATMLASAISLTSVVGPARSHPMYVEPAMSAADVRQAAFSFDWLEILPWGGIALWDHELAPMTLRRMPYLFGLHEAAGLALLPVPDEHGVPGMPRARRATRRRATLQTTEVEGASLRLGRALHHGESANALALPLKAVNRHTLIVGSSGSGKTTTVLSMLAELWREHRIPFLVIEPTKTEYRGLLETPGFDELRVICLGRDDVAPLRMNPLAPPSGVRREVHANAVLASLKLALPLFSPLPQLLDEAIDHAYSLAGWDYDTTTESGLAPPTLRSLQESFEAIFDQKRYTGDSKNMGIAFGVRLGNLLRGSRGRVLDTVESVDFDELIRRPVVIELDEISDNDDKSVFAAFILERVRAAARARGSSAGELLHVTVIEEAHRLLAASSGPAQDGSGDNARAETVKAFCDAIAELRSTGEGFILSTQSPSDLAPAAISNAATRIIHRLEVAIDRKAVLDDLDANQLDRETAARLAPGEAIGRWPGRDEAELFTVTAAGGVDSGRHTPDDLVRARMAEHTERTRRLLPYRLCTTEVCMTGCVAARRTEGEQLAGLIGPEASRIWQQASESVDALIPITDLVKKESQGDVPLSYCGCAHLAVRRDAFHVRRRVDIRPQLIQAVQP